ncbi:MAG TPA: DUF167 domain-containing protein [Aquiluna sp.]
MKISVLVKPNKRENIVEKTNVGLTVSLRAAPEKGKANAALICVLADHYNVPKSAITITSGKTSTKKIIQIEKNPA